MCPVQLLRKALKHEFASHFPVVEEGICLGMVTRSRMEAAILSMGAEGGTNSRNSTISTRKSIPSNIPNALLSLWVSWFPKGEQAVLDGAETSGTTVNDDDVALLRIMNPTPYTLLEDMPVSRLHPLFTRSGLQAACVVSRGGTHVGVLNRIILIKAVEEAIHGHAPTLDMPSEDRTQPDSEEFVDDSEKPDAQFSQMQGLRNYIRELEHKVQTLTLENDNLKVYGEMELSTTGI